MAEWICESCRYYPPSSCDGKPCSFCDPDNPLMSSYSKRDDEEVVSDFRKFITEEVMRQMD